MRLPSAALHAAREDQFQRLTARFNVTRRLPFSGRRLSWAPFTAVAVFVRIPLVAPTRDKSCPVPGSSLFTSSTGYGTQPTILTSVNVFLFPTLHLAVTPLDDLL